jgi:hypothetical protein
MQKNVVKTRCWSTCLYRIAQDTPLSWLVPWGWIRYPAPTRSRDLEAGLSIGLFCSLRNAWRKDWWKCRSSSGGNPCFPTPNWKWITPSVSMSHLHATSWPITSQHLPTTSPRWCPIAFFPFYPQAILRNLAIAGR